MSREELAPRCSSFDKGQTVRKILKQADYDFILAAVDDKTDEDMFKELSEVTQPCTIKTGAEACYATYNLHTPQMMISMLDAMSSLH